MSFDAEPADLRDLNKGVIDARSGGKVTPKIGTGLVEIAEATLSKTGQYVSESSC